MKVLMFGWEFPPHISGGLGTACFGLTSALAKSGTKVLFVIPKADTDGENENLQIISASSTDLNRSLVEPLVEAARTNASDAPSEIEVLKVPSTLTPYTTNEVFDQHNELTNWNYKFSKKHKIESSSDSDPLKNQTLRYQFSGKYDTNLTKEVQLYALVGGEIASRLTFDVIHAHDWLTYAAGIAAKNASGKPLIVHVHATEIDRSGKNVNQDIFEIEREGMIAADLVVAVSNWTKNIIVKNYGISPGKVSVIHNGVQNSNFKRSAKPPPIGKRLVTFLGRVTHQKGPEFFVEAAYKVLKIYPDVHFVMAGAGDLLPQMVEKVAEAGISGNFHFTGFLNGGKIDQLWAGSTVYVMPSVSEPFGITPLEAVQAEVPTIISRQSGVAEVLQHVIKVDFWNVDALSDAICNILHSQNLAKTLAVNGKKEVGNVTWDRAAKHLNSLYDNLTSN